MSTNWRLYETSDGGNVDRELGLGIHVLGSGAAADITFSNQTVSRRHARIEVTETGVTIEDLDSTNGTKVDDKPVIDPVSINEGSTIKLGSLVLTLEPASPKPAPFRPNRDVGLSSGESVLLGPATVGFLRSAGEEVNFNAGDIVVRRGEQQEFFYVVIEGVVELSLGGSDSHRPPLARIVEGGIFGAESVLSKAGAAVDSVAVTDVRLLRYPALSLPSALKESASLRKKLLGGIARNVHKATADALDSMREKEVIARLVQGDNDPDTLVAVSAGSKAIDKKINTAAETNGPVLLLGEDGTGKTLAARLIHDRSPRSGGPLIAVNCRDLAPARAAELILGEDLGGSLPTGDHSSGGVHLAHGGTLVLRGADQLPASVQHLLGSFLVRNKKRKPKEYPDTRVVMTARETEPPSEGRDGLVPSIAENCDETIKLPPLVKRPKDIMPLAEVFLNRHGPNPPVISEGARQALLSLRYQRRNNRHRGSSAGYWS